jgi:hypothetical protein
MHHDKENPGLCAPWQELLLMRRKKKKKKTHNEKKKYKIK